MTVAPIALAICSAKIETPPVPRTRTVSPAFNAPLTTRALHAVTPAVGRVAASVNEYPLGAWVNAVAGATTSSRAYGRATSPLLLRFVGSAIELDQQARVFAKSWWWRWPENC